MPATPGSVCQHLGVWFHKCMLLSALQVNTCFQNLYTFLLEMEDGEMEEGEKGGEGRVVKK